MDLVLLFLHGINAGAAFICISSIVRKASLHFQLPCEPNVADLHVNVVIMLEIQM